MSYDTRTHNSPNPLVRFAHRKRLEFALASVPCRSPFRLLDYGCGDGLFLKELAKKRNSHEEMYGFEPLMVPLANVKSTIFRRWSDVQAKLQGEHCATIVTCFEVLEHFSSEQQKVAIRSMREVIQPDGTAIISVPIEMGLPSMPKNLFRWMKYGRQKNTIYNLKNIGKSILGVEISECRTGAEYLSHMGFYFKDLEPALAEYFTISDKAFCPFPSLGRHFNSQVFYTLRPRPMR